MPPPLSPRHRHRRDTAEQGGTFPSLQETGERGNPPFPRHYRGVTEDTLRRSTTRQSGGLPSGRSRDGQSNRRPHSRSSFRDEEENPFLPKREKDSRAGLAQSSTVSLMSDNARQRRRAEKQPAAGAGAPSERRSVPSESVSQWLQNNLPPITDDIAVIAAARAAHLQSLHDRPLAASTIQDILTQVRAEHAAKTLVRNKASGYPMGRPGAAADPLPPPPPIPGRATAFRDRVILQKWHNAAKNAREATTIVDQGIDFDSEGNPWERAPITDGGAMAPGPPPIPPHPAGGRDNNGPAPPPPHDNYRDNGGHDDRRGSYRSRSIPDDGELRRKRHRTPQDRLNSRRPHGYERTYAPPPPPGGTSSKTTTAHGGQNTPLASPRIPPHDDGRMETNRNRVAARDPATGPRISHRDMGMASALDQPDVSGYSRTIRQRYTDMIHKRLGQPFELPPGTKPPSHTQKPDKWSGDADVDKFNRWLHSLMRWLRINQYSVPAREEECITMIGLHLDGEAAVWFDEEVEDAEDDRQWTFLRVVIGLYDRFVQPTAIQDATEEFLATEYSSTTGVRGFLDALERTAKHMIHPPDAYMFRRQFVVGLPTTIRDRLVDRGYNAERHPISDLYSVALQAEESRVMAKHYTQAAAANRARNHPGSAVATSKVDKTSASTGGPRDSSRVHRSRQHPYASRRTGPNEPANAPSAPAGRSSTTGYGQHQRPSTTDTPQRQVTSGQFNASKAKCFACGNFGHISTDPRCPKYGQPRLNAARVDDGTDRDVNDDVEASADATDDRGEDAGGVPYDGEGLEGSQYSSSGDEPDNFDRYVDAVDEGVHMGTMDAGWSERLCSMVPAVEQRSTGKRGPAQLAAIRQRYQPSGHPIDRPKRAGATAKSIAQYVTINGIRAYTLFDSGCTTDCMSPDFARVAKVSYGYLKDVIPLQLGTVGSSASIQFGTYTRASFGSIDSREYFDVANIDRYDLILGTPWMHKHGVLLDFANRMIRVGDKAYPSLTEGEESVEMARRHAVRRKE
ncbi:hypothetical protein EYR40_010039 [Pleurotus pulmonarius]|nr:hypothetical protein EYR40_010039 [Pleurotus pulmonarius]